MLKGLLRGIVAACGVVATCVAAAAPAQKIRTIEGVVEYRLANGLQVLLYPDESGSTVTVNITYNVGSRFESYGETGMAHLLEHLNFKGTPKHPKIPDELTSHGAEANATTSEDRTNYFETFPATDANIQWALGLEADRMVHSFISRKDLDSEMTVVRNEFERGENSPVTILRERVLETSYLWHSYGHPTIGARSDIERVPILRLQSFYRTYYQPDNATLIVAGKFDFAKTLKFVEQVFGAIPKPSRALPAPYTEEPVQDGEREVTLRRPGGQKVLMASYHIPSDANADSAAIGVLAAMLDDRPSGRLYKQLIETKLAVQASASPSSPHDPGYFLFTVILAKDGDLTTARRTLMSLIAGAASEPFTATELERALARQQNDYEKLMASAERVASNLSENVAAGDWRLLFWDRDRAAKVSLADVQRVAGSYLIPSNMTVGTFLPEDMPLRAAIPATPPLDELLKGYAGSAEVAAGEHFDASPVNIESQTRRSEIGGLQIAYLQKKSRGDRVNAILSLQFGSTQALQNTAETGRLTAAMLMRGTRQHTRQELQDELTRLKATLNIRGAADGVTAAIETTSQNLPQALKLAAEVLQEPAFPAADLDEIKRQRLAQIDSARTEPQALATQAERRRLSPYEPADFRYVPTFDEAATAIRAVDIPEIQAFHLRFYGASHGQFAAVGSFDPAAVTKSLSGSFASWQSASPYQRAAAVFKPTVASNERILTPDKANAVFVAAANLSLRDDDPAYPPLEVANAMLGGGFLNSRLATRIRQRDGVSYSVGSDVTVDSLDSVGAFYVYAICAPQNIAKVEQGVREEIARARESGFSADEIAAAKSGILQSRVLDRSTDAELAGALVRHLFLGRDFNWDARFEQSIGAATSDAINAAIRRYVDPQALVTIEAGDFR